VLFTTEFVVDERTVFRSVFHLTLLARPRVTCHETFTVAAVTRRYSGSFGFWRKMTMSKKAAEHHKKASEHHTHAAHHHGEAAKHYDTGHHEKGAHHAHTARGHATHARHHSEEAAKTHTEEHGKK
jgi:hypothetical protein